MAYSILKVDAAAIPPSFTPLMRAQVCYGTFSVGEIERFEALTEAMSTKKPITENGKALYDNDVLRFTQYLLMNHTISLAVAIKNGDYPELSEHSRLVAAGGRTDWGYSLGMHLSIPDDPLERMPAAWSFAEDIPEILSGGKNILELGSGISIGSMRYARAHPEHFVVDVEANVYNVEVAYEILGMLGRIDDPMPNLRIMLGDICWLRPPEDFRADLLIAKDVFWRTVPLEEDKEMLRAFLKWAQPNASFRLLPGMKGFEMRSHIDEELQRPENRGIKLIAGGSGSDKGDPA